MLLSESKKFHRSLGFKVLKLDFPHGG
jgi:hypothetical protein